MATTIPENSSQKVQEYNGIMFKRLRVTLKRMILQQIFVLAFLFGLSSSMFILEFYGESLSFKAIFSWFMEYGLYTWLMGFGFYIQSAYSLVYKIQYLRKLTKNSAQEICIDDNIEIIRRMFIYHIGAKFKKEGPIQKTKSNLEYIKSFEKGNRSTSIFMIGGIMIGIFIILLLMPSDTLEFFIFKSIFILFLIISLFAVISNYRSEKAWLNIGLQLAKWEQNLTLPVSFEIFQEKSPEISQDTLRDLEILDEDFLNLTESDDFLDGDLIDD